MFKKIKALVLIALSIFSLTCNSYQPKALETNLLDSIQSTYAIVIDYDTNQVLASKNADERMYPASLTKMMTAIIAIENLTDMSQTITITDEILDGLIAANASRVGFKTGDTPTVQDILYGIALPSGADATNAAAFTICGSIEAYVELMNNKAQEIGMTSTHFVNTTGLHDDNHYSTARDMATLLEYCLTNETFSTIFSTHEYTTSALTSAPEGIQLTNTIFKAATNNNYEIPGLIGGKTGFTYPAGYCLAAWSEVNGMHLITVTANADAYSYSAPHVQDTDTLLHSLQSWNKTSLLTKNSEISTITVTHPMSDDETIVIKAPEDVIMDLPNDTSYEITCSLPSSIEAINSEQNLEGDITVSANGETIYTSKIMIQIPAQKHLADKFVTWLKNL